MIEKKSLKDGFDKFWYDLSISVLISHFIMKASKSMAFVNVKPDKVVKVPKRQNIEPVFQIIL